MPRSALFLLLVPWAVCPRVLAREQPTDVRADEFLSRWVRGDPVFEIEPEVHSRFPGSPHKRATEEFEVAVQAFRLRTECTDERADSLAAELVELFRRDDTAADVRARTLRALGRIRAEASVDLLAEVASGGRGALREEAIRSLGFFGSAPREDLFLIFGGRVRTVVLPAAPSGLATRTLLRLARHPEPGTARAALEALLSHRGPEVAATALELMAGPPDPRLRAPLIEVLRCNLAHADPGKLEELGFAPGDLLAPEEPQPGIYRIGR